MGMGQAGKRQSETRVVAWRYPAGVRCTRCNPPCRYPAARSQSSCPSTRGAAQCCGRCGRAECFQAAYLVLRRLGFRRCNSARDFARANGACVRARTAGCAQLGFAIAAWHPCWLCPRLPHRSPASCASCRQNSEILPAWRRIDWAHRGQTGQTPPRSYRADALPKRAAPPAFPPPARCCAPLKAANTRYCRSTRPRCPTAALCRRLSDGLLPTLCTA